MNDVESAIPSGYLVVEASNLWIAGQSAPSPDPRSLLVWDSGRPKDPILTDRPPVWNPGLEALPSSEVLEAVRRNVGPRPAARVPFMKELTAEIGKEPTHGFPTDLAGIGGELRGLRSSRRTLKLPEDPHALEENGYTRIENLLFEMAREVEEE